MRFADRYVAEHFAIVSKPAKAFVRAVAPTILRENARVMLQPCAATAKRFGIPRSVLREAYGPATAYQARVDAVATPVLALLRETPRLAASAASKPTASPITTAAAPPTA